MRRQTAAILVALVITPPAGADLSKQMDVMFDSLINVTEPTAHLGQRRGAFDGGSVVARNRIMNENLVSFVPPSVSAGCGGIDLYAGSFSFISADQFQDLLRAIAANAAGYAFEVALQNMCKTCADTMNYLQKAMQAINQGMGNSCQLAKGLVNAGANAMGLAHKDQTSLQTMFRGVQDAYESRSTVRGQDAGEALEQANPEAAKTLKGNLVWRALKKSGVSGWFAGGVGAKYEEALISVTGTVIVGDLEVAPDGKGKSNRVRTLGSIARLTDFLYGPRDAGGPNGDKVQVYRCVPATDDPDGCLAMEPKSQGVAGQDPEFKGMIPRIQAVMLGEGGALGLIEKLRWNQGALTDDDKAFMESTPVGANLSNLARMNEGMARLFAQEAAPLIALDLVEVILQDALRAVVAATAQEDNAYASVVQDQIRFAQTQLEAERQSLQARYGNLASLMQYYNTLLAQAKLRRYGSLGVAPHAEGVPR
jgi:conjugative transfer pilus assembly protein TraH